jgi:hypothetical protein
MIPMMRVSIWFVSIGTAALALRPCVASGLDYDALVVEYNELRADPDVQAALAHDLRLEHRFEQLDQRIRSAASRAKEASERAQDAQDRRTIGTLGLASDDPSVRALAWNAMRGPSPEEYALQAHEGAHCVVAHALGLGVRRSSIRRSEQAFAYTDLAPFDPALDGDKRWWLTRYAVVLYAGAAGNACVSPVETWRPGLEHCADDLSKAATALTEAGHAPSLQTGRFVQYACAMVKAGERGVLGIALLLLSHTTVSRPAIVTQFATYVDESALQRLEQLKRAIRAY